MRKAKMDYAQVGEVWKKVQKLEPSSRIMNHLNGSDDEEYIVGLIKQVITVSLEIVKIVKGLPQLGLSQN